MVGVQIIRKVDDSKWFYMEKNSERKEWVRPYLGKTRFQEVRHAWHTLETRIHHPMHNN
jgi:hypothetical protein